MCRPTPIDQPHFLRDVSNMSSNRQTTANDGCAATDVRDCYQCGKCSAGCPLAEQMDLLPHQLMRLVQIGRIDRALRSEAIWKCVSCMTCSTRCPKSVDCAGVIDTLRQSAVERGTASEERLRTVVFQRAFLDNIRRNGRLRELELIGEFKTKAFFKDKSLALLFKDALLAPQLMKRKKFHLRGERVRDRGVVRRIFEKCEHPLAVCGAGVPPALSGRRDACTTTGDIPS
jgi:heterodisulfide reductase subunit C2